MKSPNSSFSNFFIPLLFLIMTNQANSQEVYLFPDWIVDELLEQDIPSYIFCFGECDPEVWEADIRGYTFHWDVQSDGTVTYYVPGTDIYFQGNVFEDWNERYLEYVLGINWLAYFGVLPGGGYTVSSTIMGESFEDMTNIVLMPIPIEQEEVGGFEQEKGETELKESSIWSGLRYEAAEYHNQEIKGFSIPIHYYRYYEVYSNGINQYALGFIGNIQYASISDASIYHINISPYYKRKIRPNIEIGGLFNSSITKTSFTNDDIPSRFVLGIGGFGSLIKQIGKMKASVGLLVEPKYGDGAFALPIVYGLRGSLPISNGIDLYIDYTGGSDRISETDEDDFNRLDIKVNIFGIYSIGYEKVLNVDGYENNIVYINFKKLF